MIETKPHGKDSFIGQINKYIDSLRQQVTVDESSLIQLKCDLELKYRKKYKIHYVVDYCEIETFSVPFEYLQSGDTLSDQWSEKLDDYMARAILFEKRSIFGPMILLPPYIIEMHNRLNSWQLLLQVKAMEKEAIVKGIQNILNELLAKDVLIQATEEVEKFGRISNQVLDELVPFIIKEFRSIISLLCGTPTALAHTVQNLLRGPLCLSMNYWSSTSPENKLIRKTMGSRKQTWLKRLNKIRVAEDSHFAPKVRRSNLVDAKALDIVCELNRFFIKNNMKEIVLLVSSAESMAMAVNGTPPKHSKGQGMRLISNLGAPPKLEDLLPPGAPNIGSLLRTPSNFSAYVRERSDGNIWKTLNRIGKTIDLLRELDNLEYLAQRLRGKCIASRGAPECNQCATVSICTKVEEKLKKVNKLVEERAALKYVHKRDIFRDDCARRLSTLRTRADKALREGGQVILKLLSRTGDDANRFDNILKNLMSSNQESIRSLFYNIAADYINIESDAVRLLSMAIGEFARMPSEIKVQGYLLQKALKKLEDHKNIQSQSKMVNAVSDLLKKCQNANSVDRSLALGVMFMGMGRLKRTISISKRLISGIDSRGRQEGNYLKLLAEERMGKFESVEELCEKQEKKFRDDARFPNLRGFCIEKQHAQGNKLIDLLECGEKAINLIRKQENRNKYSIRFKNIVKNNYAYWLYLSGSLDELKKATVFVNEILKSRWKQQEWPAEVFQTIGLILEKKEFLSQAHSRSVEWNYPQEEIDEYKNDISELCCE
ncbi:hypothetical protein K8T06_12680 [bacterium]|nr:hypothetical protein [bacterium]